MGPDSLVDQPLSVWEDCRSRGKEPTAEELCQGHPDRKDEVQRQIDRLRMLGPMLADPATGESTTRPDRVPALAVEIEPAAPVLTRSYYRPLRLHAVGGLGEIYVARDESLGRDVALKFIRRRIDHDARSRRRFQREVEITGGLDHPGIVPVHGVGHDESGRPYYAMRLVRGESLQAAIDRFFAADGPDRDPRERRLAHRALLGRLVGVCNAVAYAHSRGIIHRDLKPSNIMLGLFHETLVVDWGLAKRVDSDAPGPDGHDPGPADGPGEPTLHGAIQGTPAYMSPEQAAGRSCEVGPASDIYSLGAILLAILTGRVAFRGRSPAEVRERVARGSGPTPRLALPDVHPALEAIYLRAMEVRPQDRYQSALDLAADLERWLADEPVSAWREPPGTRFARWVRRHRPLVAGLSATLVVAVVALGLGLTLIGRQRAEAVAQRDRARANLDRARQLVGELYDRDVAGLANRPGTYAQQREILQKTLRFYEEFALPQSREPAVLREAARAALRVGDIQYRLGRKADAEAAYLRSREMIAPLIRGHLDSPDDLRVMAGVEFGLGHASTSLGHLAAAGAPFRHALEIREQLCREFPPVAQDSMDLGDSYMDLGLHLTLTGQYPEAEAKLRKAIAVAEAFPDAARDGGARARLGQAYHMLGYFLLVTRRDPEAEPPLLRSVAVLESLDRDQPGVNFHREMLGFAIFDLAHFHQRRGRWDEAETGFRRALAIRQDLDEANPGVSSIRDLAFP